MGELINIRVVYSQIPWIQKLIIFPKKNMFKLWEISMNLSRDPRQK